ncbi:MAG: DUF4147 domain-containing protein [Myxococcales bacterium]|nr:DUF4147 domain-containing protein [Myxococcales bacterium]
MDLTRLILGIDLRSRVAASLGPVRGGRCVVIALGKGAPSMARGALDAFGRVDELLVVTSDDTDALGLPVVRASHPLPDARSVEAGRAALALAASLGTGDTLVALVSGGASSLACAPAPPLDLAQKRALAAALLGSGAPIEEINVVRRHASLLKGGGLLGRHRTLTRVASDVLVERDGEVVEGAAATVGSGPASACVTTKEDARRILARWAPHLADAPLVDHHGAPSDERCVAGPLDLARAACHELERVGYQTTLAPPTLASVDALAQQLVRAAEALGPGHARVQVGEPSVRLPRDPGVGGRLGRLALLAWRQGLPADVRLACLASDGVDGGGGGGAIVRGRVEDPSGATAALAAFADAPFLERRGALVPRRPSGQNFLDLLVLVRDRT